MKTLKTERCDCGAIHEDAVAAAREGMLQHGEFSALAKLYGMLADGTRIKILWALSVREMCVCDLAVLLDMTKSAVSHALGRLRDTNLVRVEKRGKSAYYTLHDQHVAAIILMAAEHLKE